MRITAPLYPIGIQDFIKLRSNGYTYVDKTKFIFDLVQFHGIVFLSRPRRFGKSLFLSTLQTFFEGKRKYFHGLAIDSLPVDWDTYPVLHFDFNAKDYSRQNALEEILQSYLDTYEELYGATGYKAPDDRFRTLIRLVKERTGKDVVVLVDEYDKPLLSTEENSEEQEKNRRILKGFFGVLKTMDHSIRFGMITGVGRFSKVSIFSDLNNLKDISMSNEYAEICGLTQSELEENFSSGIEAIAQNNELTYQEAVEKLRVTYDGYKFSKTSKYLYNPFSVLNAFSDKEFKFYWFHTGTPTMLAQMVKRWGRPFEDLTHEWRTEEQLTDLVINNDDPVPLMFQTGYLTLKKFDKELIAYELGYPNLEVEKGFLEHLAPLYFTDKVSNADFDMIRFRRLVIDGKIEDFMKLLYSFISDIPYTQRVGGEKFYQNVCYILFTLLGFYTQVERFTYIGRIDFILKTSKFIYIFEFKFGGTAEQALRQIKEKDYAGPFKMSEKKILLIGANFDKRKRNLGKWIIEEV
ncbi:MAG: ATP-binding protein [Muribaculaceae bacterium]|nr:ATP-binding protein [Muribaculaceae bacterium]